jgi:hypothetical protein
MHDRQGVTSSVGRSIQSLGPMEFLQYPVMAGFTFVAFAYALRWLLGLRFAIRKRPRSFRTIFTALLLRPGPYLLGCVGLMLWYYSTTELLPSAIAAVVTVVIALFWLYRIDVGKTKHPGRKAQPRSSRDVA